MLAESGEDAIAFSDSSNYAANVELAPVLNTTEIDDTPQLVRQKVATPNQKSIDEITQALGVKSSDCIKLLIVKAAQEGIVALALRGDHELNTIKAEKLEHVAVPLTLASDEDIKRHLNTVPGYIGPFDLDCRLIVDYAAANKINFVCGANETDAHWINANWPDIASLEQADLRNIQEGDPSPDGHGKIQIKRGIEVGHIFQLGDKYSQALNARVLDQNGKDCLVTMGCYGIGVSRVVAAAIEQNFDDQGIIWPHSLAPFQVSLIPINMYKSEQVENFCNTLYKQLTEAGVEVLYDDRNARPGQMFADHELIGVPQRIVVSERGLQEGIVEYKLRHHKDSQNIPIESISECIKSACQCQ